MLDLSIITWSCLYASPHQFETCLLVAPCLRTTVFTMQTHPTTISQRHGVRFVFTKAIAAPFLLQSTSEFGGACVTIRLMTLAEASLGTCG